MEWAIPDFENHFLEKRIINTQTKTTNPTADQNGQL